MHGNGVADLTVGKNVRTVLFLIAHKMENRALGAVPPPPYISRQKSENREVIPVLLPLYSGYQNGEGIPSADGKV
jgi:hypothetical protein